MAKRGDKHRLQDLAAKWLNGTITPSEEQEFNDWFREGNEDPVEIPEHYAVSEEEHRSKILLKIREGMKKDPPSRSFRIPRMAVAASITILLALCIFFYWKDPGNKQPVTVQAPHDIGPGGSKAMLTLANGHKIDLGNANTGELASQGDITIIKNANDQLVYSPSKTSVPGDKRATDYNTIETPVGGEYRIILPDGTKIWLNAVSSLRYPARFTGKERVVTLTGEAYFEVAKDKTMPFKVINPRQTIEVLGTHFNVMAYPDEALVKTTLLEGAIKVSNGKLSEYLKPGQQSQVTAADIQVNKEVDVEDAIAWKNGYFKFNENLESIMNKIARWYNVEIIYEAGFNHGLSFGGEISRAKNLSAILEIMALTGNVHFRIEGRKVFVMK